VARWRFWFFCCWVRVLLRGGRLDWEAEALTEEFGFEWDEDGDGDMLSFMAVDALDGPGVVMTSDIWDKSVAIGAMEFGGSSLTPFMMFVVVLFLWLLLYNSPFTKGRWAVSLREE
jgi:hypothetical protein